MLLYMYTHLPMTIIDVNENVRQYCTLGDWTLDLLRTLGFWIYKLIASILDDVEMIFDEVSKINLTEVIDLTNFENALTVLVWIVLGISVLIAIGAAAMKSSGNMEYLKYTIITVTAIICFNIFNQYMIGLKDTGIDVIKTIFASDEQSNEETISHRILYSNSYDILESIKDENQTLYTINTNIPIQELSINKKIDLDDLEGTIERDADGNVSVDYDGTRGGGFFTGDLFSIKYYQYYINFPQCIVVATISLLIYIFCSLKLMYLVVDWFFSKVYGTLAMAMSVSNLDKVKMVYTAILQLFISILITNAGVKIFEVIIAQSLIQDWHFVTKSIFIFTAGIVIILGSSNMNKFFGIDDGTNFMLRSFMLTRMMKRMAKGMGRMAKGVGRIAQKGVNTLKNAKDTFQPFDRGDFLPYQDWDRPNPFDPEPNNPAGYLNSTPIASKLTSQEMPHTMYGGENAENLHYHREDGVDRHYENENKQAGEKMADKKARYERGQQLQNEIENRQSPFEAKKQSQDTKQTKPKDYQYKSYEQYKRDFAAGDSSVYKKPSSSKYAPSPKKTLPDWFYTNDADPVRSEKDDAELMQNLRNLGNRQTASDDDIEDDISTWASNSENAYEEFLKNLGKKGD